MKTASWMLSKRKGSETEMNAPPIAVEDRKITMNDYRTIWRRSQETYIARGVDYEFEEPAIKEAIHLQKQKAIEDLIASTPPRSRIISVTDLRFEEKRTVTPLASILVKIGDPYLTNIEGELNAKGFYISPGAKRVIDIIKDNPIGVQEMEFGLFKVKDISPERVSSPDEFFSKAEYYNYGKCSPETGLYARLSIPQEGPWNKFCIGMDPINDSDGNSVIFCVKQTGQCTKGTYRSLTTIRADSGYQGAFSPDNEILLRRFSK